MYVELFTVTFRFLPTSLAGAGQYHNIVEMRILFISARAGFRQAHRRVYRYAASPCPAAIFFITDVQTIPIRHTHIIEVHIVLPTIFLKGDINVKDVTPTLPFPMKTITRRGLCCHDRAIISRAMPLTTSLPPCYHESNTVQATDKSTL